MRLRELLIVTAALLGLGGCTSGQTFDELVGETVLGVSNAVCGVGRAFGGEGLCEDEDDADADDVADPDKSSMTAPSSKPKAAETAASETSPAAQMDDTAKEEVASMDPVKTTTKETAVPAKPAPLKRAAPKGKKLYCYRTLGGIDCYEKPDPYAKIEGRKPSNRATVGTPMVYPKKKKK